MAKRSRSHIKRLAALMEVVEWKGNSNWTDVQEAVLRKYILEFKAWIKEHSHYIRNEKALEVFEKYYLNQESLNRSQSDYNYLEQCKMVFYALYQREQDLED